MNDDCSRTLLAFSALEAVRRGIATAYPACRDGESCPHPEIMGCECQDLARRALNALPTAPPAE